MEYLEKNSKKSIKTILKDINKKIVDQENKIKKYLYYGLQVGSQVIQSEKMLVAEIPPEFKEGIKNGTYKILKKSSNGSKLPEIVDSNGKIVKILELKEVTLNPDISKLLESVHQEQMIQEIMGKLDTVVEQLESVRKELQDDRYAYYYAGYDIFIQSKYIMSEQLKIHLQAQSINDLEISERQLMFHIETALNELKEKIIYKEKKKRWEIKGDRELVHKKIESIRETLDYITRAETIKVMEYVEMGEKKAAELSFDVYKDTIKQIMGEEETIEMLQQGSLLEEHERDYWYNYKKVLETDSTLLDSIDADIYMIGDDYYVEMQ